MAAQYSDNAHFTKDGHEMTLSKYAYSDMKAIAI